jgi:hypothetical protein
MAIVPRVLGIRALFVLVLFFVALVFALVVRSVIENQPEYAEARSAVENNTAIQNTFGAPIVIGRGPEARYRHSSENGHSGTYSFTVEGSKASGTVYMKWSNPGNGEEFVVESLWIELPGEDRELVWPHPNP